MKIRKIWIFLFLALLLLAGAGFGARYWWMGGEVARGSLTPPSHSFSVHDNIVFYRSADALPADLQLDLFVPDDAEQAPVAIILFGGAWVSGSRHISPVRNLAGWFAERGVIGVPLDYRLVPRVPAAEQPRDVARGVAWVVEHIAEYGGDPANIFLVGHSAGAHLSSLVACDRTYLNELDLPATAPAGVIAIAGVFDVRNEGSEYSQFLEGTLARAFGKDLELRRRLSPLIWVGPATPPFLILRGKGDHLVPKEQFANMTAALSESRIPVDYRIIPGRDHIALFEGMTTPGDLAGQAALSFIQNHSPSEKDLSNN